MKRITYREAMRKASARYLRGVIAGRSMSAAARVADVHRTHLYYLCKRDGVKLVPSHVGDWGDR